MALLGALLVVVGCLSLPSQAAAAPGALKILIAYADGPPNTLKGQVEAHPEVSVVDLFDARLETPTVAQMSAYDEVVVFSNNPFQDAVALGDRLADYQDGGGRVAAFLFGYSAATWDLKGRWMTGGYTPFVPSTSYCGGCDADLGELDAASPLMHGVASLHTGYRADVTLAAGATLAASWDSAPTPAVASKGRGVGVNAYVGDGAVWSGDFAKIIVNAADVRPAAVNDPGTVTEDDTATTIDVLANDTDSDGGLKTIESVTQPANGTVAMTNSGADLTYEPHRDYCNDLAAAPTDDFIYTLNGGSQATVAVTVTCVDEPQPGLGPAPEPGPAPSPPGRGVKSPDTTAPILGLRLSPSRFLAGRGGAGSARQVGTRVVYQLSERARVRFRVERAVLGRRVGGRCVARRPSYRHRRSCRRHVRLPGSFVRSGRGGHNSLRFRARLRGRALPPALYRLVAVPTDMAANRGRATTAWFRVLRAQRVRAPRYTG